jgi:hypothetical protein
MYVTIINNYKVIITVTIYVCGSLSLVKSHAELVYWAVCNNLKADSHIECRAHAVPLSCRAAKGLEYVCPI